MSELSRRSGVAIPTIKFYLREGLLPSGHATATNQADYDEDHLRRLRLVRALISFGGLSVTASREVLNAISEPLDLYHTLGVTHYALGSPVADTGASPGTGGADAAGAGEDCAAEAAALVERMGWTVSDQSPGRAALAAGLRALRRVDASLGADELAPYAELAEATARLDLDHLTGIDDRIDVAERALVLTVLLEPVLATLRRLAQENEAMLRYPSQPAAPERDPEAPHAPRAGGSDPTGSGSHRSA
ncbi:MerR family transcriptional regulator [Streptomyces sp. NPDC057702]|uniref:MerR family transcriptional regulator n=1 Tax=unclassified Streptomyces TaxID=2593676 RepID=UPI003697A16E